MADEDGNTLLFIAAASGKRDLLEIFLPKNPSASQANAVNYLGWTPLMQAARYSQLSCVRYLIPYSDVFKKNRYGLTAFCIACSQDNLEVIRLLLFHMLKRGAAIPQLEQPISPLTLAVFFGNYNVVQYLIGYSFDIQHSALRTGVTPKFCAELVSDKRIMSTLQVIKKKTLLKPFTPPGAESISPITPMTPVHVTSTSLLGKQRTSPMTLLNSQQPSSSARSKSPIMIGKPMNVKSPALNQRLNPSPRSGARTPTAKQSSGQIFFPADFEIPEKVMLYSPEPFNEYLTVARVSPRNRSPAAAGGYQCVSKRKESCIKVVSSDGQVVQTSVTTTYVVQKKINTPKISLTQCSFDMLSGSPNNTRLLSPHESHHQLQAILQKYSLGHLIPIFLAEEIDFTVFVTLSQQDLLDIGITDQTDLDKLLCIIDSFR